MKLFLDTAHIDSIESAKKTGLIQGVTTNPTLLSKEGGDMKRLLKKICAVMDPYDVSIEVTELDAKKMYSQAKKIAQIAPNVVVKIPCKFEYVPIIKQLVDDGTAVNITLVFSAVQGLVMSKLGVKYISPFIGRLDDTDTDGMQLVAELKTIIENYGFTTQILAASIRTILHVTNAALIGADVATIPVKLFESLLDHPLTDKGLKLFDTDWKKLNLVEFPS